MKKKILVIRSVSFQQLDKNLAAIETQFPISEGEYEIHLLTHAHGIPHAQSYTAVSHIIDYGSRGNFSFFHLPRCLKRSKSTLPTGYEAIVVPVTNMSGAGFLNVLLMSLRIPAASIYICNLVSEMWKVPRRQILFRAFKSLFYSLLAAASVLPLLIFFIVIFPFFLLFRGTGKKKGTPKRAPLS